MFWLDFVHVQNCSRILITTTSDFGGKFKFHVIILNIQSLLMLAVFYECEICIFTKSHEIWIFLKSFIQEPICLQQRTPVIALYNNRKRQTQIIPQPIPVMQILTGNSNFLVFASHMQFLQGGICILLQTQGSLNFPPKFAYGSMSYHRQVAIFSRLSSSYVVVVVWSAQKVPRLRPNAERDLMISTNEFPFPIFFDLSYLKLVYCLYRVFKLMFY